MKVLRPLTLQDVTVTVTAEKELGSPRGRAIQASSKNPWTWCCAKVTVEWQGLSASDYLSQCSYRSKQEFINEDPNYPNMVKNALQELNWKAQDQHRAK